MAFIAKFWPKDGGRVSKTYRMATDVLEGMEKVCNSQWNELTTHTECVHNGLALLFDALQDQEISKATKVATGIGLVERLELYEKQEQELYNKCYTLLNRGNYKLAYELSDLLSPRMRDEIQGRLKEYGYPGDIGTGEAAAS